MRRHSNGKSPNVLWNLGADLGDKFEKYITNLIIQQLKIYHPNVKVKQTPRVGDGGKDIIVISKLESLNILGQTFYLNGKKEINIFFECKSTNENILRYEKIASSHIRSGYQNIDYYVLVTNSGILPQSYYLISEELRIRNIKFKLMDGLLLGDYIAKTDHANALNNPYMNCDDWDFYYEYQVDSYCSSFTNGYDIYFIFRNYSNTIKSCELQLRTDVNWQVTETKIQFIINAKDAVVKKITVKQNHFDGIPELLFNMQINGIESTVFIEGLNGIPIFEPPFIGEDRKEIINSLEKSLKSQCAPSIICFWGDAGIGKTRLAEELAKHLNGTYFDFGGCKIQRNSSPEKMIQKFLKKNGYISDEIYPDLSTMISNSVKDGYHAIYVLDDFHNASQEFIVQIKKLKDISAPITFLICGRTDFSAGDLNYLSFIEWAKDNLSIYNFEILPLKEKETENLIRVLIDGIPNYALKRLQKLSMNNPLFIIQYIEYMLDINLVKLVNRNTVGIVNINKFHSKMYMPRKISEIYEKRISNLSNHNINGQRYVDLLYKIAICNGNISSDSCYRFFEEDHNYLKELIKRRFLKYDSNENIVFVHESLYLFTLYSLNKKLAYRKKIANEILEKTGIELILNSFQIGRVNIFASKFKLAEIAFSPILNWLENVNNYSNNNINVLYYEYLPDIFDLAIKNPKLVPLAKKAILMRIYISLHHFAPIKAVNECDEFELIIKSKKNFDDISFLLSIKELKAHALMNSGLYTDGETLLKEIQAYWLDDNKILPLETLFDLYDRLSSVYKHFNLKNLSVKYNNLSLKLAERLQDSKLKMLANRTKFKLYLYSEKEIALSSLLESCQLNNESPSARIKLDNDLDVCGFDIIYNQKSNWEELVQKIESLCKFAESNEFSRARIHGYFLLAICYLKMGTKEAIKKANYYTERAINISTAYGIGGYMWRLHNLLAIIKMRLNFDNNEIYKLFCTVFEILDTRGLLYLGNRDFCHGNILAISNLGYFLQEHKFETTFNEKMSQITYINKNKETVCLNNNGVELVHEYLLKQYISAKEKKVLFLNQQPNYLLRDDKTNYIIIL